MNVNPALRAKNALILQVFSSSGSTIPYRTIPYRFSLLLELMFNEMQTGEALKWEWPLPTLAMLQLGRE